MSAKRLPLWVFASFATVASGRFALSQAVSPNPPSASVLVSTPPVAPVRPVVDDYYGNKIAAPYRYMENLKDPEAQSWMKAQNDYTRAVLATIPGREKLLARIAELNQSAPALVSSVHRLQGDLHFYLKLRSTEDVPAVLRAPGARRDGEIGGQPSASPSSYFAVSA